MTHEAGKGGTMIRVFLCVLPLAVFLMAIVAGAASAQTALPEITVSPPQQPPKSILPQGQSESGEHKGDEVNRGREKQTLDQLNQRLRRKVDETNPTENTPPIDARSSDLKTGIVNMPAVQQQYGKNFGRSVIPYRPAAPVYTPPIGHR